MSPVTESAGEFQIGGKNAPRRSMTGGGRITVTESAVAIPGLAEITLLQKAEMNHKAQRTQRFHSISL
jgi:hypothetical protein